MDAAATVKSIPAKFRRTKAIAASGSVPAHEAKISSKHSSRLEPGGRVAAQEAAADGSRSISASKTSKSSSRNLLRVILEANSSSPFPPLSFFAELAFV
jgi:hypothetical protein